MSWTEPWLARRVAHTNRPPTCLIKRDKRVLWKPYIALCALGKWQILIPILPVLPKNSQPRLKLSTLLHSTLFCSTTLLLLQLLFSFVTGQTVSQPNAIVATQTPTPIKLKDFHSYLLVVILLIHGHIERWSCTASVYYNLLVFGCVGFVLGWSSENFIGSFSLLTNTAHRFKVADIKLPLFLKKIFNGNSHRW